MISPFRETLESSGGRSKFILAKPFQVFLSSCNLTVGIRSGFFSYGCLRSSRRVSTFCVTSGDMRVKSDSAAFRRRSLQAINCDCTSA